MVQHNMKKKVSLPNGVKQKRKMKSAQSLKKGHLTIAPKKSTAIQQAKIDSKITRIINDKNEQSIKSRADKDVGRNASA